MRRFDKKLNIQKLNLLNEQRYYDIDSNVVNESNEVESLVNNMMSLYSLAIAGRESMDWVSAKVYYMVKKTLEGQDADTNTKKGVYIALANKIKELIPSVTDEALRVELDSEAKTYSQMASMVDKPLGNATDLFNHLGLR